MKPTHPMPLLSERTAHGYYLITPDYTAEEEVVMGGPYASPEEANAMERILTHESPGLMLYQYYRARPPED